MKNRKIRKTLRQIERLPLPAREKTIGSAALPPEPPRRLRALRFAGQAAAVAVVLTLLTATLLFALRRPAAPPETSSASGMLAAPSDDASDESTASDSSAPDETSRDDLPFETLRMAFTYNNRSVTLEGRQMVEPAITEEERLMAENLYFRREPLPAALENENENGIEYAVQIVPGQDAGTRIKLDKYEGGRNVWSNQYPTSLAIEEADSIFVSAFHSGALVYGSGGMLAVGDDGRLLWEIYDQTLSVQYVWCLSNTFIASVACEQKKDLREDDYDGTPLLGVTSLWNIGDPVFETEGGDGYMAISNPWTIAFYDEFLCHSDKLSFECEYGQMYFSDIQYYGGKMYISAYTTPAMMDGNLLLRYDYLNEYVVLHHLQWENNAVCTDELSDYAAQDQRAFLLVVDPRTLKPEDFCFVDGAMPGDLRITETGELCWSVKPIISVCISEVGVDFVTRLTEYTFDENMVYQGRRHGYTEVLWPYIGQEMKQGSHTEYISDSSAVTAFGTQIWAELNMGDYLVRKTYSGVLDAYAEGAFTLNELPELVVNSEIKVWMPKNCMIDSVCMIDFTDSANPKRIETSWEELAAKPAGRYYVLVTVIAHGNMPQERFGFEDLLCLVVE